LGGTAKIGKICAKVLTLVYFGFYGEWAIYDGAVPVILNIATFPILRDLQMKLINRNSFLALVIGSLCLASTGNRPAQAAFTISNATTSVTVYGGEANNGLVPAGGYFDYTDLGTGIQTAWSIDPLLVFSNGSTAVLSNGSTGGFGSPSDLGGGVIRSTASTSGIDVQADTQLVGSNAQTTFTFTASTGSLDGITFVFYAENDIQSFSDDTAAFTGSIAGGDLALFQYDTATGGLTVRLTGEAGAGSTLSLFGAGLWPAWGTSLEAGDLTVLSADGSNFATSGDLGLALAFSLTGSSASLVINYDTQPLPPNVAPAPSSIVMLALVGACFGGTHWLRRRRTSGNQG
jgi:hypothetical protein